MSSTEDQARQHFAALAESLDRLGRPDLEYSESPYFGDYVVTGKWPEIQFRLVSDKGLERCEVRTSHSVLDNWFDLPLILSFLQITQIGEMLTLEEQVALIGDHLQEVLRAFRSDEWPATKRKLESLQIERAKRRFGWSPQS